MKIVLLNGPPSSGKDTIGRMLDGLIMGAECFKFAQPIIDYMASTFGVSCDDGEDKDKPCANLSQLSRRQVAIKYSEEWIKPNFGIEWFGHRAQRAILTAMPRVAVFTDSGFVEEATCLYRHPHDIVQVRIHRPGFDFSDDSRSYWHLNKIPYIDFHNSCNSLESLKEKVETVLLPRVSEELGL